MEGDRAHVIGSDGYIVNRVDILTDDEAEARRLAIRVVERSPVELWQGARMSRRRRSPTRSRKVG